jgi:hypothetical protein
MKKLSLLLINMFLLITILLISGCGSNNSTATFKTITNSGGNVSISVPSDWNADVKNSFPGSIIAVGGIVNREYVIITAEAKLRLGANSTINDYLTQIKTAFTTSLPDGIWGNPSNVTINGLKGLATQVIGTSESSNTKTTCFVYALASKDYYYSLVGVTNTGSVNANKATLQKTIYSFKVPATAVSTGWRPYRFPSSVILSFILLIIGIGLVILGRRMKTSINVPHPGKTLKIVMIITWVILILGFLFLYAVGEKRTGRAVQNGPIFPITFACAVLTFAYLIYISRRDGILSALGNGIAGAAAAPMIFEFPFDLIVIPQVNASIRYLIVFFTPLFVIEIATLSLLLLSKRVSITRYSLYSLGAMFIVFAVWALEGFSYPSSPAPFILNAISKILSFTTIIALFSMGSKQAPIGETKEPVKGQTLTRN